MKKSIIKMIKYECWLFVQAKGLDKRILPQFEHAAMKSYQAMSRKDRSKWSLEQVLLQGLV